MMFLISCTSTKEIRIVKQLHCDGFKIITVSKQDILTLSTARQILSYNEFLEVCKLNR